MYNTWNMWMSSILGLQPSKRRPFSIKTVIIWVPGCSRYIIIIYIYMCMCTPSQSIKKLTNLPKASFPNLGNGHLGTRWVFQHGSSVYQSPLSSAKQNMKVGHQRGLGRNRNPTKQTKRLHHSWIKLSQSSPVKFLHSCNVFSFLLVFLPCFFQGTCVFGQWTQTWLFTKNRNAAVAGGVGRFPFKGAGGKQRGSGGGIYVSTTKGVDKKFTCF